LSEEVNQFVQKQQMSDALKAVSERVLPAYEDLQRDARDFLTNQRDRMNSEALDVSASASSTRVLAFVSVGLDEVATAMRQVTESAVQVQRLSNEVNAGSEEQARAIEQISKAILQIQQVTQQTAASAEEGAIAGSVHRASHERHARHARRRIRHAKRGPPEKAWR